jgi:hypothetical protein
MKKVLLLLSVVALVSSCKKDYACTCYAGTVLETTVDYNGLSKSEAETAETACTLNSACNWEAK